MEVSSPNSALLSHPEPPEFLEPLSRTPIPRPHHQPDQRDFTVDYAYSTIRPSPKSLSPLGLGPPSPAIELSPISEHGHGATPGGVGHASTRPKPIPPKPEQVDAVIYLFHNDICTGPSTHVRTLDELKPFLERGSVFHSSGTDYLLLIEDIPDHAVQYLASVLNFNPKTAVEHAKGRVNAADKIKSDLHVNKLRSTLFDHISRRDNQETLTWWRLFSHSRDNYTLEKEALNIAGADTHKITVPHFEVHISDTFRKSASEDIELGAKGVGAFVKAQWQKKKKEMGHQRTRTPTLPSSRIESPRNSVATPGPTELKSRDVYKLDSVTYRAHQVVTEVSNDSWGTAAEERITFSHIRQDGSNYYILLFDKPRGLREYIQKIHVKDALEESSGLLSKILDQGDRSEVTVKTEDSTDKVVSTFLFDKPAPKEPTRTKLRGRARARKYSILSSTTDNDPDADATEFPQPLPKSTRERFIEQARREGLFDNPPRQVEGQEMVVRKAKLVFAALVAKDWNLLVSQMSLTLDEIDTKMSDNISLQENALAWRRLLCSWRVSLVEYATRLEESKQLLLAQMSIRPKASSTTLSSTTLAPSMSGVSTPGISRESTPSIVETAANRPLEDVQDILYRYQILREGVSKVEQRVDRSFQAIMSSMSILESERAITQGVAIARLTELAFIFIPLSFAAAFFSMQVKDFEGDHQPHLKHFFAMGIVLIFSMYCLRAFLRSSMLATFVRTMERKIRDSSRVPGTEEIPARVVFSFAWQQLTVLTRTLLLVIPFFVVALVLIIALGHHVAFKAVGSVLLILGTLVMLWFIFVGRYLSSLRTAIILTWALSLLGAGLGGSSTPNAAILGTVCTLVTTICVVALASIPQNFAFAGDPWLLVSQILVPLWTMQLPFTVLYHFYKAKHWEPWQMSLASMSFIMLFSLMSPQIYTRCLRYAYALGYGAFTLGIPLSLTWSYWPLKKGDRTSLYGQLLLTCFSVSVFAESMFYVFGADWYRGVGLYLAVTAGVPLSIAWGFKPHRHGGKLHNTAISLDVRLLLTLIAVIALVWAPCYVTRGSKNKDRKQRRFRRACLATCTVLLIGIPMIMTWHYDSHHGDKLPLYAKLLITVGSVVICSAAYQLAIYRRLTEQSIFLGLFLLIVGVPNIVVWAVLTPAKSTFPFYGKLCVTFASVVILSFVIRLSKPFSQDDDWRTGSWLASGMALAAWVPTIVWTVDTKAMEPIRRKKSSMIHITWTSILFWVIVWSFVRHYAFARVVRARVPKTA